MSSTERPACPDCGLTLTCADCDDQRPTAEDLFSGWALLSPFGRWETVTRTDAETRYGPLLIYTAECGDDYPWRYARTARVTAYPPRQAVHGEPEIRIVDTDGDTPIMAFFTNTSHQGSHWPFSTTVLASASYAGRGKGWDLTSQQGTDAWQGTENYPSKAAARAALRTLAEQRAKAMRVKLTVVEPH